jgi:hypothetical protein
MTWRVILAMLRGETLPPLPPIAGRVIKAPVPTDADPLAESWDAVHPNKPTGGDQDD